MMPTFEVTQEQLVRIASAFGGPEVAEARYIAWVKEQLIQYVVNYERTAIESELQEIRRQRFNAIRAELGGQVNVILPPIAVPRKENG